MLYLPKTSNLEASSATVKPGLAFELIETGDRDAYQSPDRSSGGHTAKYFCGKLRKISAFEYIMG